ncbi:MAG TPA: DUF6785 family protein [Tepidisphaeraceae bacterium]
MPPASTTSTLRPEPAPRRGVTWRSLLLGLLGVVGICALAPYNDFAMSNTLLVGNFLPIGVVLIMLVVLLLVNAPLLKFAPRHALREGELAVALAMMLAACSLPSSGLMRYLPAGIVSIPNQAIGNNDYLRMLEAANVPHWLLPSVTNADVITDDPVFRYYRLRSPDGSVPWAAWARPLAIWGVFVALLWGLMLCLSLIVRRQWTENERLAFPLASVYMSLIEAPEPGRALNRLFSSPGFWIAAGIVFCVHSVNAVNQYVPRFPVIPIGYDMNTIFIEQPWSFFDYGAKSALVYFSIVGMVYFVQTRVAFSLWAFYVLWQIGKVVIESHGVTFTEQMRQDQTFGGIVVFAAVVVYVGRQHWWMVIRHMFPFLRRPADALEPSRYLPYAAAGWGAVLCFAGLIAWLMTAGVSLPAAALIMASVTMLMMTIARIVAETGLVFAQVNWPSQRLWTYSTQLIGPAAKIDATSFLFAGWMAHTFHDVRESFATFFQQGVRVADGVAYERTRVWKEAFGFLVAVVMALVVGYVVSAASMLWVEYNYAEPLGYRPEAVVSIYATESAVKYLVLDPAVKYAAGTATETPLAIGLNITGGALVVGVCSVLRLTLAWWPLHPIGFIVAYTYAGQKIWFSILLGWLAKTILLRLGGASLLLRVKPVFIGLVVGEAFAAAFWLVFSIVMHWSGHEYRRILLLPG